MTLETCECWPYVCTCAEALDEWEATHTLATCGGCGAYGDLGTVHYRKGEECGEFV